jgi:hypothetical protein
MSLLSTIFASAVTGYLTAHLAAAPLTPGARRGSHGTSRREPGTGPVTGNSRAPTAKRGCNQHMLSYLRPIGSAVPGSGESP